jgi:hypothetical protein
MAPCSQDHSRVAAGHPGRTGRAAQRGRAHRSGVGEWSAASHCHFGREPHATAAAAPPSRSATGAARRADRSHRC